MELSKAKEKDLFEELGLEVAPGEIEVGQTYPIFGMVTGLINETPGSVVVEINYNITAKMNIQDKKKIEILKGRAFESGIFVAEVLSKGPEILVECKTVIFGRPQAHNA